MNRKRKVLAAVGLSVMLTAMFIAISPRAAYALDLDVFEAIEGTISQDIGTSLNFIHTVQSTLMKDQQTILYPLSLINSTRNYVNTIKGTYRGWMTSVLRLPINSAQLPGSQSLETAFLSGSSGQIPGISGLYTSAFGQLPIVSAAPAAHRQMMDMDDALAQDAMSQAVAADQSTASLLTIADNLENETIVTAPGTADLISAAARASEIQSLAIQHKLLASMLREEAGSLAHATASTKQNVIQMQQMNGDLRSVFGQR